MKHSTLGVFLGVVETIVCDSLYLFLVFFVFVFFYTIDRDTLKQLFLTWAEQYREGVGEGGLYAFITFLA